MASTQQKQMLQFLMHKRLVSAKELQKAYSTITGRNGNLNDLKDMVRELNELIKPVYLNIKSRFCEDSHEEFFAFISVIESDAAKYSVEFTQPELDLFKQIMKEILASESRTVSTIDCVNYSSQISKLSKTDAEKALEKFLTSHWLKEKEGEVSFTVRTLLELEPLLMKLEPDLTPCTICNCLAVKSVVCPNESCGARSHRYCLSKMSRGKSNIKCPSCSSTWSSLENDSSMPSSSQGASQNSSQPSVNGGGRRRTRIQTSSDSD